jgi:hypothetical protein
LGNPEERKLKDGLARLQSIHHPAILTPTVVHADAGRVFLLTDIIRGTLRSRAQQCPNPSAPGIPRAELVDDLRAAAEVLDYLYQQHNVQHLNLNPRNLMLDNGWLQVADFGYAQLLWSPAGQDIGQRNVRYAAPELFTGVWSRHCDQYSLALIYAEMLTGVHPFRGYAPARYLASNLTPELDRLPDLDAAVLRRALDADPAKRWANCTEMLLALEGAAVNSDAEAEESSDYFTRMVERELSAEKKSSHPEIDGNNYGEIIAELIASAGGQIDASSTAIPVLKNAGNIVEFRFVASMPLGAAQERLQQFSRENDAKIVRQDDARCTLHIALPRGFWRRCWGGEPKLELNIEMVRVNFRSATPIEIRTKISAVDCFKHEAVSVYEHFGAEIFSRLQQHLLVNADKRTADRLLWPHPIKIYPLDQDGRQEEPVECRGKDLAHTGIAFYLPHDLRTCEVLIELPNPNGQGPVKIPATLVRVKRCADGWYDVGALFRMSIASKSQARVCS